MNWSNILGLKKLKVTQLKVSTMETINVPQNLSDALKNAQNIISKKNLKQQFFSVIPLCKQFLSQLNYQV